MKALDTVKTSVYDQLTTNVQIQPILLFTEKSDLKIFELLIL